MNANPPLQLSMHGTLVYDTIVDLYNSPIVYI